ncbi:MAG: FAD-linked oxidase C-terminal domain-containing protein [Desulfobacterales bacterium]
MDSKIKEALIKIVGPDNFTDTLIDRVSFSYDSSGLNRRPAAAVWIKNTPQVSEILKLANRHKFPVTPRGAGTSLTGSAVPQEGGLVLDMSQMKEILKISIEDRLVVVQPGVVFEDLNKALAPLGLHTGSNTMKCVSGYDLTRLFVGSEGTLGVVTEITLKINPRPRATRTCSATFNDLPQAGRAVSEIMRSGIIPSVLELMDSPSLQAVNQATDLDLPEVEAMLLAETDGYTQQEADGQMDKIVEALKNNNAGEIVQASTTEEADKLWRARMEIYGVLTRLNYNVMAEDLVVPISKVAEMLTGILDIGKRHNILIATVAHAGDGNIHPVVVYDGTNPAEATLVKQVEADLFKLAIDLGGTLTGEHGVGISKSKYMRLEHDSVFMQVMNDLKKLFDPNAILNPGKLGLDL